MHPGRTRPPLGRPSGPADLFSKFDPLIAERQALLDTGVQDPFSLVMEKVLSPTRAIVATARRRSCSAPTIIWA